jgi:C1A family cysteine protease
MENIDPYHDQDKLGGHEMVIIGYDDNAISTDRDMKVHHGLLTLRNSWGDKAGDHGNYYMSYDFFKKFAMEVQFIYRPNLPQ